jgi:type VI secretion system ImpM family protein
MYRSTLGYYGKLPVSAEFIRCQASGTEIDELDQWFREGMYYAKSHLGSSWPVEFVKGDPWGFLYLPRENGRFLTGMLKPSCDKAGREFPFLLYLILNREEFREIPWSAPMHFKDFFEQGYRVLSDADAESDFARLQFRLQALSPVQGPEDSSIEARYRTELLHRRMKEHWAELFGEFDCPGKYQVFEWLFHQGSEGTTWERHLEAKLPLLLLNKEEAYDLPFWIDVASRSWGRSLEAGILLWNRRPSKVLPLLFVSFEQPTPELLLCLIRPDHWSTRLSGRVEAAGQLTDAERALLDDGDVTLEAFLHRLSSLRV